MNLTYMTYLFMVFTLRELLVPMVSRTMPLPTMPTAPILIVAQSCGLNFDTSNISRNGISETFDSVSDVLFHTVVSDIVT